MVLYYSDLHLEILPLVPTLNQPELPGENLLRLF